MRGNSFAEEASSEISGTLFDHGTIDFITRIRDNPAMGYAAWIRQLPGDTTTASACTPLSNWRLHYSREMILNTASIQKRSFLTYGAEIIVV